MNNIIPPVFKNQLKVSFEFSLIMKTEMANRIINCRKMIVFEQKECEGGTKRKTVEKTVMLIEV